MTEDTTETQEENEMTDTGDTNTGLEDDLLKGDDKDLQRLKSWVGRTEATAKENRQLLESISQKLEAFNTGPAKPQFGEDEQAKLNEKLHEMVLDGRVTEAINLAMEIKNKADRLVKDHESKALNAALSSLGEEPVMKNPELSQKVMQQAQELVGKGYDPNAAAMYAKNAVENDALRQMMSSGNQGGSLDLLGTGGKQRVPAEIEKKLPEEFERSYQQGLEKGLFKDRDEYIDLLSPAVRRELGL